MIIQLSQYSTVSLALKRTKYGFAAEHVEFIHEELGWQFQWVNPGKQD